MPAPDAPPDPDPPAVITADEVRRIARLAHLEVTPADVERLTRELGSILGYVKQLEELDLTGVPPTAHVQRGRVTLRSDEPETSLPRELALREAPRVAAEGFAVPAFVDDEG